jgi:ATP-dependent RNA helicase DDX51/DBP6
VASSDDDDEKHSKSTLKVIAPSQPAANDSKSKRKHEGFEDEAIDDFDADFDIIENENTSEKTSTPSHMNVGDVAAARALRLSKLPIAEVASDKHWSLPPFLLCNLEADSYTNFFPIQCMVIPDVIESERNAYLRGARDVCCHAPTGSGKTLAFVLPLLTSLYNESPSGSGARGARRLRALVVLPGRDLAKQVYEVFVRYAKGSHLRIGLAVGGGKKKTDLVNERRSIVVESYNESWSEIRDDDGFFVRRRAGGLAESAAARARFSFDPTSIDAALDAYDGTVQKDSGLNVFPEMSGRSSIDILVSTPGRLVDHLDSTPGFTLQHLRFLVIDEADRLVNQPYQNWVGRVLEASNSIHKFDSGASKYTSLAEYVKSPLQLAPDGMTYIIDPITHRSGSDGFGRAVPLRKMLFSATLTQDPQKLAVLGLNNPKHFDAGWLTRMLHKDEDNNDSKVKAGSYSVPPSLTEKLVECTAEQKPLVLLALLLEQAKIRSASKDAIELIIVFTSSVDSTHRLARLLQLLWEAGGFGKSSAITEISSAINAKQRAATLRRCRSSNKETGISVVVCSDGMSRGMDFPSVAAVINYDVPAYAMVRLPCSFRN